MADFASAFKRTMKFEDDGLTGKVTTDAGGRTRFGIAEKFHPELPEDFFTGSAEEARAQAEKIELAQYWKPLKLDQVSSQDVASKIFDMAVNMGAHQAAVLVQRAVNFIQRQRVQTLIDTPIDTRPMIAFFPLAEDGCIGPKTLEQLNMLPPKDVLAQLRGFSEVHYKHIAANNPEQAVNLAGWLRRAAS